MSKVKFLKLFLLGSCFLRENYVRSWAFPTFSAFSVQARKLNQQPAVNYYMGNRDFIIKRNKVNISAAVDIFLAALLFLRGLNVHDKYQSKDCFYMGHSRMSFSYHTSLAAKMTTDSSTLYSERQC